MTLDIPALKSFLSSEMPKGLEMLRQMVAINSFTANRDGVNRLGRMTAGYFASLGFTPEFVPSTNTAWGDHLVMTRSGRSDQTVAMVAHLDTVFPPEEELANHFQWQPEGDRIYGPGTLDMKGGTMMMWLVLRALQKHAPATFAEITWKLFWNSSEESLSPDFEEVCRHRLGNRTAAILVFEAENRAGDASLLVAARKGRLTWKATVTGRAAHAGGNLKQGANALIQLASTVQRIHEMTDFSNNLTFNVGRFRSGTVLNRVPHEAVAEGECRAFSPEVCAQAKACLLGLSGKGEIRSLADNYACDIFLEITSESRPWPRNPQTDRLLQIWIETASELGLSARPEERGGLSDGNGLWDLAPTLDGLGPGGDNDHCSERSADGSKLPEYVEISSFVPKAVLNTAAIVKLLSGIRR